MADNIKYRFIQNVGDYFPSGYFGEDFLDKVQKCAAVSGDEMKELNRPFVALQHEYDEYKNFIINGHPRIEDAIKKTHDFHTRLLKILGYDTSAPYSEHCIIDAEAQPIEMIPVRHILRQGTQVKMFVMEMQNLIAIDDHQPAGLFEQQYDTDRSTGGQQRYAARQWRHVFQIDKEQYKISPAIINKAVTQIFLLPEERRPHFILMMAGNTVFLFDKDKWARGSYLEFSLDELFSQARIPTFRNYYALFYLLVAKQTLTAESEQVLMDIIIEESYKNAYEVTRDLKEGVILAVETLANEALYYWKQHDNIPVPDYTDDSFEAQVKDDCLTLIYRLLFLFYAESRGELEILPVNDEVYNRGYSLESLRDLEMVRLNSEESRNGYFFDHSIRHLFRLLSDGYHATDGDHDKSFRVRPIDSPLFNDSKLHHLADVKIRNVKWQEIIRALSLSKKKNYCGRISYANLGVNQLGSVYESLLAYRGFYAEEDYIEVFQPGKLDEGTYLVPYSRMGDFDIKEVVCDPATGEPVRLPKGTFVYRLNGRDRKKSASYYTPEVLTRSTVKYTLKSIIDEVRENKRRATELLELKILEPAMGAAAFQNEVINQLAEAYLTHQQRQQREAGLKNWRIAPDRYRDELQKVKAYIATHNVYGVDLNPTAIELGKLSLWLNVIHKDMETPFFANRLAVGNAVIGAWLKVYSREEVIGISDRNSKTLKPNKWWTRAPHKVKFFRNSVNRTINEVYHFLLPDAGMLGVRSIKEQKRQHPDEDKHMQLILKNWTAAINSDEFRTLQRISAKIDVLLKAYFTDQLTIERYTNNRRDVWDGIDHSNQTSLFRNAEQMESYAQKQQLFDTRYGHNNAYRKLKLAMDYWCALWFWSYEDTLSIPKRDEFWADIEALLDVDDDKIDARTRQSLNCGASLFDSEFSRITEEESEIIARSQNELLTEAYGRLNLFADDDPLRLKIASRLAERYRFFHPMLEFIEVFWLRDGFDIICGNPPWIKLEFDEQGIISEKYPEIAIRKVSAPQARTMRDAFFAASPALQQLYREEELENAGSTAFLNAYCNYPLLVGQQTNLYKCVLTNCFDLSSVDRGYIGLLCPESIYDDPKGQPLRKELYKRLRYHFQYQNELRLFAEVHHHTVYGDQLLGPRRSSSPRFASLSNLYHPATVDACFAHDGHGLCGGIKTEDGKWKTAAHRNRIVYFTENELRVLSEAFEDGTDWETVKLTSIHAESVLKVLERFSEFPTHIRDYNDIIISEGLNETNSVDKGIIQRNTCFPNIASNELVYSGPHFFAGNPLYKTPRNKCVLNSDYDTIDLNSISENYVARTNYTPKVSSAIFRNIIQGFPSGQDKDGKVVYDCWMDYYKMGFRRMVGSTSERTLSGAILLPKCNHIDGVVTVTFKDYINLIEFAGLTMALPMDFYVKTLGISNIHANRVQPFPLGILDKYKPALFTRTLLLNCLTSHYANLWKDMWNESYKQETWSKQDARLKPFDTLTELWDWNTPLRNYFERRQALVEIDVIAAMALGLTLEDLEMIYNIQFPVLQQNENDTWYDAHGQIVFTCSKGLTGVGIDRTRNSKTGALGYEDIRGEAVIDGEGNITGYRGTASTHTHTIDPAKSELYGGQQQTFVAPYTRCDRIADYRTAWTHFEKQFNVKNI